MVAAMQLGGKHFQASPGHASVPESAPGRNHQRKTTEEAMEEDNSKCDAVPEEDDIVRSDQGQQAQGHTGDFLCTIQFHFLFMIDFMDLHSLYPRLNLLFSTFGILRQQLRCDVLPFLITSIAMCFRSYKLRSLFGGLVQ